MPSASVHHTTTIAAPAATVWAALQEAATWSGIGPIEDVWDPAHLPDDTLTGFSWSAHAAGRDWRGTAHAEVLEPGRTMAVHLESSEICGSLTTVIIPGNDGCTFTAGLTIEPVGLLATMFWGVVRGAITDHFAEHVDDFAARF
jgi:hypothetical protein